MANDDKITGALDIFPDGWGMIVDPAKQVDPDEARQLIDAIIEQRKGKKES